MLVLSISSTKLGISAFSEHNPSKPFSFSISLALPSPNCQSTCWESDTELLYEVRLELSHHNAPASQRGFHPIHNGHQVCSDV